MDTDVPIASSPAPAARDDGARDGESVAGRATRQLQQLILERDLQAGDVLPAERELGELFGVSRTVVREAVKSLAAKGLVDVRRGHGTVVTFPDVELAAETIANMLRSEGAGRIAFSRVHEVRRLLEVEIAGLAAERREGDDLAQLRAVLDATEAATTPAAWARNDIEFHATLARAAHNPLLSALLGSMTQILLELRRTAARLPDTQSRAQRYHRSIFEAVEVGATGAARKAMRAHMNEAESTFQRARVLAPSRDDPAA